MVNDGVLDSGVIKAITGDTRLVLVGRRLLVQSTGASSLLLSGTLTSILAAVAGLFTLTYVPLSVAGRSPWPVGLLAMVFAVALGLVAREAFRRRRVLINQPTDRARTVAIFDLERRELQSSAGNTMASMDTVQVRRRTKFYASKTVPTLMAEWPTGSVELAREHVFSLGLTALQDEFRRNGITVN